MNYGSRLQCERGYLVKLGGLNSHALKLKQIDNLIISACGTSYHAGLFGSMLMRELECFNTIQVCVGSEINEDSFPLHNPGVLTIT